MDEQNRTIEKHEGEGKKNFFQNNMEDGLVFKESSTRETMKNDASEHAPNISEDENTGKNQLFRPEMLETDNLGSRENKLNSTYVLLVIFLVLLGISYFVKDHSFRNAELGEDKKIISPAITVQDIDKVEVIQNGTTTVLEHQGDIWKVASQNNFEADQDAVKSLVEESLNLNKYIIASENKEKSEIFEVNEEKGVNIKLYSKGEEKGNFYVGKAGPDFDSTYVRLANEEIVYLSKGYVRYYFDKDDWRDLTIYDFESTDISKIALKYRNISENIFIEKKDDKWQMTQPEIKEADKDKTELILNTLAHLKAKDVEYAKTHKEAGFATAPLVIRLEQTDGGRKNLLIGGKIDEDKYYAKKEEDDTIYIINKSTVDGLMKKVGDF